MCLEDLSSYGICAKKILAHLPCALRDDDQNDEIFAACALSKDIKIMKILPHMPYALRCSKQICHIRLDALSEYAIFAESI